MASVPSVTPPWQAWIVVVAAFALGVYEHLRSPMGVFLSTPTNWCAGRTHAFGLGYGAVLAGAAVAAVLVLVGSFVGLRSTPSGEWRLRLRSMCGTALRCLVLFALAAVLTPMFERSMPLKADPRCEGVGGVIVRSDA